MPVQREQGKDQQNAPHHLFNTPHAYGKLLGPRESSTGSLEVVGGQDGPGWGWNEDPCHVKDNCIRLGGECLRETSSIPLVPYAFAMVVARVSCFFALIAIAHQTPLAQPALSHIAWHNSSTTLVSVISAVALLCHVVSSYDFCVQVSWVLRIGSRLGSR